MSSRTSPDHVKCSDCDHVTLIPSGLMRKTLQDWVQRTDLHWLCPVCVAYREKDDPLRWLTGTAEERAEILSHIASRAQHREIVRFERPIRRSL